jgi:acetyltransferase-like isoleucine patch superfamily enzyme
MKMSKRAELDFENTNLLVYFWRRVRRTPFLLLPGVIAFLNGWRYKIKFLITFRDVSIGKFFRVYGPLVITGPGRVEFGDNCIVISNAIKPVCIRTLSSEAVVRLGQHVGLNGTSIQCVQRIEIGRLSNIADAYITDTAAHSLSRQRRFETVHDIAARPVIIGENVWISVQVVILDGVSIGDNSVIGACSLVRADVPANVFAAGNPLAVLREITE